MEVRLQRLSPSIRTSGSRLRIRVAGVLFSRAANLHRRVSDITCRVDNMLPPISTVLGLIWCGEEMEVQHTWRFYSYVWCALDVIGNESRLAMFTDEDCHEEPLNGPKI